MKKRRNVDMLATNAHTVGNMLTCFLFGFLVKQVLNARAHDTSLKRHAITRASSRDNLYPASRSPAFG